MAETLRGGFVFLIVRCQKYNKTHSRSIVHLFPIIIMKYQCSNVQYNIL